MKGYVSGLAVPQLAVDLPGGGGKITIQPQYRVGGDFQETVFRNYLGQEYRYPEPEEQDVVCPYEHRYYRERQVI